MALRLELVTFDLPSHYNKLSYMLFICVFFFFLITLYTVSLEVSTNEKQIVMWRLRFSSLSFSICQKVTEIVILSKLLALLDPKGNSFN